MVPRCKFGSWGSGGGAPRVLQAVAPGVRAAARVGARCRSECVPRLRSGGCGGPLRGPKPAHGLRCTVEMRQKQLESRKVLALKPAEAFRGIFAS